MLSADDVPKSFSNKGSYSYGNGNNSMYVRARCTLRKKWFHPTWLILKKII